MPTQPSYTVQGEAYNVREELGENAARFPDAHREDWREYRVRLIGPDGETVGEWDSFFESYLPGQGLTEEECEKAILEARERVAAGHASDWFTLPTGKEENHHADKD